MPMELDLHIHSTYSFDSLSKIKTIIKTANKKGLEGIAITDHNTICGGVKAVEQNFTSLLIIVGNEINTDIGDLMGLFLNEEIRSKEALSVLDEIRDQGGLSVLPHPFTGHDLDNQKTMEILRKVDAIEGINSRHPITNVELNFLKNLNKPLIAGSDAHFASEIGLCKTILSENFSDLEEIRKNLQKGTVSLKGVFGPKYFRSASEIIKMVKTKKFCSIIPLSVTLFLDYTANGW